jgi:hypothetical protein
MLQHSSGASWVLISTLLRRTLSHLTWGNVFVCSHSEEKAFLMDALQWGRTFYVMVIDNCQLKIVSGSSPQCPSVIYHSNRVLYPNTLQATWTATSLVRTASFNAPSFHNFCHLIFNSKDPKSIIMSKLLCYMHLRLSSAYCSNLLLPRKTLNTVSLYRNHHICTSGSSCTHTEEVRSWDGSYPEVLWFSSDPPPGKCKGSI